MTLTDLLNTLKTFDQNAPLVFLSDETSIRGGYHVTELKAVKITSIDCAGRTSKWDEAALQLLDGSGGAHMPVGKFVKILDNSLNAIDALHTAPAHVEFAHRNAGLRRHEIADVAVNADQVDVRLTEARASRHLRGAKRKARMAARRVQDAAHASPNKGSLSLRPES